MLPADMGLLEDENFLPHVKNYANNEKLFISDFSNAYTKLTQLGCKDLKYQKWTNKEETLKKEYD
jgi:catalase (peroxidase I)